MTRKNSVLINYQRRYCEKSQDFRVFLNFKQLLKQLTFFKFSQLIIKINLHKLLATYLKYFDTFVLDTIKVIILEKQSFENTKDSYS